MVSRGLVTTVTSRSPTRTPSPYTLLRGAEAVVRVLVLLVLLIDITGMTPSRTIQVSSTSTSSGTVPVIFESLAVSK
jgi:hypothetical protein